MLSNLAKKTAQTITILNILTLILLPIGVYLSLNQPSFYIGKATLYSKQILPLSSILIFLNLIFITKYKPKLQFIPQTPIHQALLLFTSVTAIFSLFSFPQNTLWYFSGTALCINLLNTDSSETHHLSKTIWITTTIISIIALLQFILQSDIGLQIIGEPNINSSIKGIAKIKTVNIIRAYGLFQHPNILGAIITLSLFISPYQKIKNNLPLLLGLISSFSITSVMATSIKFIRSKKDILIASGILISLILFRNLIQNPQSILQRIQEYTNLIIETKQLKPWEIQPIHNTFLLSLTKFGPIHFITLLYLLFTTYKKRTKFTLALIILFLLDHYFLTNYSAYLYFVTCVYIIGTNHYTPSKNPSMTS